MPISEDRGSGFKKGAPSAWGADVCVGVFYQLSEPEAKTSEVTVEFLGPHSVPHICLDPLCYKIY